MRRGVCCGTPGGSCSRSPPSPPTSTRSAPISSVSRTCTTSMTCTSGPSPRNSPPCRPTSSWTTRVSPTGTHPSCSTSSRPVWSVTSTSSTRRSSSSPPATLGTSRARTPDGPMTPYDAAARHALYRRSLAVVVCSQIFGGAGLAAGVTVGALLAQQMVGGEAVAGVPVALFTLGSALAAFGVGRLTQRSGRRLGLTAGFLAGAVGAAGIVVAAVLDNPPLFFVCLFVYGAGTATNLQARYAGTDLAPAGSRATAVSVAMVATTLGAVAGPNLVEPLGHLAAELGIPALAGPFLLAAVAYGL